jgi:hypothetical protein
MTDVDGSPNSGTKAELDPLGSNAGTYNPYLIGLNPDEGFSSYPGLGDLSYLNGKCRLDGLPVPCAQAQALLGMGFAEYHNQFSYYASATINGKQVFGGYVGVGYSEYEQSGRFTPTSGQQYNSQGFWAGVLNGTVSVGYGPDSGDSDQGKHDVTSDYHVNILAGRDFFLDLPQNTKTEEHGLTVYRGVNDTRGGSYLPPCADDVFTQMGLRKLINLDNVRIHIGIPDWVTAAAKRYGGIVPKAITVGDDIYFSNMDDLDFGKDHVVSTLALIGHELTHVYQHKKYGDKYYLAYIGQWAKNGFRYGGKFEEEGDHNEQLLMQSIPQRFGNDPCRDWRH